MQPPRVTSINIATTKTTTHQRYKRYQDEFCKFCVRVCGDTYDKPSITTDNVYNFLFFHAYHRKIPKNECGKRRRCYTSQKSPTIVAEDNINNGPLMDVNGEPIPDMVDVTCNDILDDADKELSEDDDDDFQPPPRSPSPLICNPFSCGDTKSKDIDCLGSIEPLPTKWFDYNAYMIMKKQYEQMDLMVTDLSIDTAYIGYTHLNGIRSALVDFAEDEVRHAIRLDRRIKVLISNVKSRIGVQNRLQQKEKVTSELPHWELMPVIHKLETLFWDRYSDTDDPRLIAVALRDRWCYNDSFQCIVRAELLWKEELSDMVYYSNHVPGEPDPYEVMVRVLWEGKTNQKSTYKSFLAQCFPHIEPKQCAIGSKAMYLFARFRVTEEEFDFTNNEWFKVKTSVALADRGNKHSKRDFRKRMGPRTYAKVIKRHQKMSGLITGKTLHVGRKIGVIIPQLAGAPNSETMILGNWARIEGAVFNNHYNAQIPYAAMRSCAGAGKDIGRYYLPCSHIIPPEVLQKMVWPNIERAKEQLFAHRDHENFVTAHRFIKTMDYLAKVFLQDAA